MESVVAWIKKMAAIKNFGINYYENNGPCQWRGPIFIKTIVQKLMSRFVDSNLTPGDPATPKEKV